MSSPEFEQRKEVVIREIEDAFSEASIEDGVTWCEAGILDRMGSDEERAAARRQDVGISWQDLPAEIIQRPSDNLYFLDDTGFRYYVPAFLIWCLRNMDDEDLAETATNSHVFEKLLNSLGANGPCPPNEHDLKRYKLFSREQAQAVAHFLEIAEQREDSIQAANERSYIEKLLLEGATREYIDERQSLIDKIRAKDDTPESLARCALDNYWGQFL